MYYSFSSFFFFSRSRTVQTQLSSSRDAAVRPRVFRGARERWRDHTRCRWEETALTLERGSVRTEARARSFAYLLPTAPRIPFDLFPFNLPADRPTIQASSRRKRFQASPKERRKEEERNRCAVSIYRAQYRGKGRSSRFSVCYFSTDRMDGQPPSSSISRKKKGRETLSERVIYGRWNGVSRARSRKRSCVGDKRDLTSVPVQGRGGGESTIRRSIIGRSSCLLADVARAFGRNEKNG